MSGAPQAPRKVLIVDDHPIVRDGMSQMIADQPDLVVCGEAGTAPQAVFLVEQRVPDLVIVDIFLENSSGLDLVKYLRQHHRDVAVLVVSMHDEMVYAERALKAGARGYVMKQEASRTILDAMRKALRGEIHVSDRVSAMMAGTATTGNRTELDDVASRLTNRELEIFRLLGEGVDRVEIARRLQISVKTLEAHRGNMKARLKVPSAAVLLRLAWAWVEAQKQKKIETPPAPPVVEATPPPAPPVVEAAPPAAEAPTPPVTNG
jgi:DNA-binding NarL/FixJ family response regulator